MGAPVHAVPPGTVHWVCDLSTLHARPGLSFPTCTIEADALLVPAMLCSPGDNRKSKLSPPGPNLRGAEVSTTRRIPGPCRRPQAPPCPLPFLPERIPGPQVWEELSSCPGNGPQGPGHPLGQTVTAAGHGHTPGSATPTHVCTHTPHTPHIVHTCVHALTTHTTHSAHACVCTHHTGVRAHTTHNVHMCSHTPHNAHTIQCVHVCMHLQCTHHTHVHMHTHESTYTYTRL